MEFGNGKISVDGASLTNVSTAMVIVDGASSTLANITHRTPADPSQPSDSTALLRANMVGGSVRHAVTDADFAFVGDHTGADLEDVRQQRPSKNPAPKRESPARIGTQSSTTKRSSSCVDSPVEAAGDESAVFFPASGADLTGREGADDDGEFVGDVERRDRVIHASEEHGA